MDRAEQSGMCIMKAERADGEAPKLVKLRDEIVRWSCTERNRIEGAAVSTEGDYDGRYTQYNKPAEAWTLSFSRQADRLFYKG